MGGGGVAVVLSAASAATAGAILASHRPRHPVGWLLLTFALVPQAGSPLASVRNPLAIPGLAGAGRFVAGVASPAIALTMAVAAASLVGRFRRARGVERLRLRWLALAAALGPAWANCCRTAPAWSWPPPPWPRRRCSNPPAAASSGPWTGASTAAAMTPPAPSRRSAPGSGIRWT
jgi:hypothetical protein